MGTVSSDLNDLIGHIYDAAADATRWNSVAEGIRRSFAAEVGILFSSDAGAFTPSLSLGRVGYGDNELADYAAHFQARDLRIPTIMRMGLGEVYVDDWHFPFAEVERSEIFDGFYRPLNAGRGLAVRLFEDGVRSSMFSVHKAIGHPGFSDVEVEMARDLAPHLIRALQLQRQLANAQTLANGMALALDHFSKPVWLVNATAKLLAANRQAEAWMHEPSFPLTSRQGILTSRSLRHASTLAAAIATAVTAATDSRTAPPPLLFLPRQDGQGKITLMIAPATPAHRLGLAEPALLIFASDPAYRPVGNTSLLAQQFGLSKMEADVAVAIGQGRRLEEIADARRVSLETIRTQAKSAMAKCGATTQTQLASLVGRSLAAFQRPSA